ncbi:MAG: DUF1707 domain-containing protein [Spirochaetales bacterium]
MAELEALKTKTTELLTEGWRSGLLTEEEYTWRSGHVTGARDVGELEALVSDLLEDRPVASSKALASRAAPHLSVLGSRRVAASQLALADTALSVLGNLELDYRGFPFASRQSLQLVSVLGEALVIIPPGIRVKSNLLPVLGEVSLAPSPKVLGPEAPVLEIMAVAVLGSLRVVYRES